ncbi:hypothetical protein AB0G85_37265 [Streptomyces sioyaensis]|uniref:hypothetical protein n=1 Tax=Streptomyces sioyaensis TaxID=67364 RepID=UPI0033D4E2CE
MAVARSILVIARHLINDPDASYQELGADWHRRHLDPARKPATSSASSRPSATESPSARHQPSPVIFFAVLQWGRWPPGPA